MSQPKTHTKKWPKFSAGSIMTSRVPTARPTETLEHVRRKIEKSMKSGQGRHTHESINYIYVVTTSGLLVGVLSIQELFTSEKNLGATIAGDACEKNNVVTVVPSAHQERVAYLALKHNIKAVPVVDSRGIFLGVIPSDVILRVLYKETHEDLMRRAGIRVGHELFDNILTLSIWRSLMHRIPWLLIGLFGGVLAAQVVTLFETTLQKNLILAAFMPLIVYMGDAVGTQMEAFIIRDIAINHKLPFVRYVGRQFLVVLLLAVVFGSLLMAVSSLVYGDVHLGFVLSLSLGAAICSSVFTGLLIPYTFHSFKMDPANASGPVATILQDLLSIVIYFGVATALL